MNIMEIVWEDGKQYKDIYGNPWIVDGSGLYNKDGECITEYYGIESILKMQFEEVIDWSKVEVDTPIWVRWSDGTYKPRHFSKYDGGEVHYWAHGQTSHTSKHSSFAHDKNVLLTKPKED